MAADGRAKKMSQKVKGQGHTIIKKVTVARCYWYDVLLLLLA